jgi:hypothetical protein
MVLLAESEEDLLGEINVWKTGLEVRCVIVNTGKLRVMRCEVRAGLTEH